MPIYMQYGSVRGDVSESSHANWIELSAVNWGLNRPASNSSAPSAARGLAAARMTELSISKQQDSATIPLIQESLSGAPRTVTIEFVRTGADQAEVYYALGLKDTLITAFGQASGSDRPIENLTLNFTEICFQGTQVDKDGRGTSPSSYAWSVANSAPA